jgi:hypothetical protein
LLLITQQVEESIKGAKIINYRSKVAAPASSSAAPASAAESAFAPASAAASASAAPPNLHLSRTKKVTFLTCILMYPL